MIALIRAVLAWFTEASVSHRFDPAECRERQRQAAIAAAFYPHLPADRRSTVNQEGFQ